MVDSLYLITLGYYVTNFYTIFTRIIVYTLIRVSRLCLDLFIFTCL